MKVCYEKMKDCEDCSRNKLLKVLKRDGGRLELTDYEEGINPSWRMFQTYLVSGSTLTRRLQARECVKPIW